MTWRYLDLPLRPTYLFAVLSFAAVNPVLGGLEWAKSRISSIHPDLWLNRALRHPGDLSQIHVLELHVPLPNRPSKAGRRVYRNILILLVKAAITRGGRATNG